MELSQIQKKWQEKYKMKSSSWFFYIDFNKIHWLKHFNEGFFQTKQN